MTGSGSGKEGILLVVSAPSGAGKTTLCRRLVAETERLSFSVSYTTRPRRGLEQDGVDYHFVSDAAFDRMLEQDLFAEWATVHGQRYGTSAAKVQQALDAGQDLVFDIDWQGGVQLLARFPRQTVLVFILPPSMEVLARRLRGRATDSEEVMASRLARAREEISHFKEYHYLLVNDDLERAHQDLRAVYRAARLCRDRQVHAALKLLQNG